MKKGLEIDNKPLLLSRQPNIKSAKLAYMMRLGCFLFIICDQRRRERLKYGYLRQDR